MSMELLEAINERMHPGATCPAKGSIGECPAMSPWNDENPAGLWWAVLSLWDDTFNDSAEVVRWFEAEGATVHRVEHTLWCADNGDRDGRDPGGAREWVVTFTLPAAGSRGDAAPDAG